MSHDAVRRYHYRGIFGVWLTTVTVWLFSREGVAKSPCKCGSWDGIYNITVRRAFCQKSFHLSAKKISIKHRRHILCRRLLLEVTFYLVHHRIKSGIQVGKILFLKRVLIQGRSINSEKVTKYDKQNLPSQLAMAQLASCRRVLPFLSTSIIIRAFP